MQYMIKTIFRHGFIYLLLMPAGFSQASDLIRTHGVELFTSEDMEFLDQAIVQLLESAADGESISWVSPNTGANGTLELIRSYEKNLQQCREVDIISSGKGYTDHYTWGFCYDESYNWSVDY